MAKTGKDPVAILYEGKRVKDGEDAPETVKFYHNERPTTLAKGKSVKGFTRAEALAIMDNAATWKINAKLVIKELMTQEEADEETTEETGAEDLDAMKKPALLELAEKEGVEVKPTAKKEDIIAAIKAKRG